MDRKKEFVGFLSHLSVSRGIAGREWCHYRCQGVDFAIKS